MEEKINEVVENDEVVIEKPDYSQEIVTILRGDDSPKTILTKLEDYHGSDLAQALMMLPLPERRKCCRVCNAEMLAKAFEHLEEEMAAEMLSEIDSRKAAAVVSEMETDTAVDVLRRVTKERRALIIDAIHPEIQNEIRLIASFDEDEIGSRMTTNYICIRENLSVKEAMNELIRQAEVNDNIATLFVVDESGEFYGALDLQKLITARSTVPLENLIVTSFPYVYANETTQDCIEKLKNYSETLIPVLNNSNQLLGILTSQNIVEAVDEELGEDYAKLAGLTAEEDLNEPLFQSMKKRLPWLIALLVLGLVVSGVVGAFERVVSQLTLIMAFQSLILGMAGNVGTQSLAVTVRVLMDENLRFRQKIQLVAKEMRVGLCNGILLGSISFLLVGLYILLFKEKTLLFSFSVSGCIGISLVLSMVISSAVGTLIPLFFKKINLDPAVASGPLITTVNDLVAVTTYYGISWALLLNVMHLA